MVYSLSYRRPSFVSHKRESSAGSHDSDETKVDQGHGSRESLQSNPRGIPEALSFDRLIEGGTCPPCTTRDFLNYLKYIERAPENLQFFLWYRDYKQRFQELPESEQKLAPEWTSAQAETERKNYRNELKKKLPKAGSHHLKNTDFDEKTHVADVKNEACPFEHDTPMTPSSVKRETLSSTSGDSTARPHTGVESVLSTYSHATAAAFEDAGLKQPFTVQPYRDEVSRIVSIYIVDDSPRQLNLSGRERHALLKALEYTTHPTAFGEVISETEVLLRRQAHPSFTRWAICNGNRPRVIFARGLGIFTIVGGLVADILLTLSSAGRGWRVLPIILYIIGFATLIAAWKGMCVVLHGLHHQHIRPWELFSDSEDAGVKAGSDSQRAGSVSIDSLRSESPNSFEDEPWIAKYKKRNIIRKVFDRETYIQEPALRQIQDTIALQALIAATVLGAILVAIFVGVPAGRLI